MAPPIQPWATAPAPEANITVSVRPIRPSDAPLLDAMHRRLSLDSLYARYFQPASPSIEMLTATCSIPPERGAAFVAVIQEAILGQRGAERVVGLAYYVCEPEQIAEMGILVEDRFQGQGIGRSLWHTLCTHARQEQIRRLRVIFAPSNRRMAHLLQGSGLSIQATMNYGMCEYLVTLDEPARQGKSSDQTTSTLRWNFAAIQERFLKVAQNKPKWLN